jgi:hypothetical protein
MERVAQSRSPEQIWAACVDFWQRAVEDYGKEYVTMGRLATSVTGNSMAAAPLAIHLLATTPESRSERHVRRR